MVFVADVQKDAVKRACCHSHRLGGKQHLADCLKKGPEISAVGILCCHGNLWRSNERQICQQLRPLADGKVAHSDEHRSRHCNAEEGGEPLPRFSNCSLFGPLHSQLASGCLHCVFMGLADLMIFQDICTSDTPLVKQDHNVHTRLDAIVAQALNFTRDDMQLHINWTSQMADSTCTMWTSS